MRAQDQGFEISADGNGDTWNAGHGIDVAWPKNGWGTPFSCFRFAIPELHGFQGRAVYMDADMLVLGDVAELLAVPLAKPWVCCHPNITDVSVIDCAAFKDRGWLTIEQLKKSGLKAFFHVQRLNAMGLISPTLSWDWNCRDANDDIKTSTKLLHYTTVPWQPYKPYPNVKYHLHPKPEWSRRWFDEALAAAAPRDR